MLFSFDVVLLRIVHSSLFVQCLSSDVSKLTNNQSTIHTWIMSHDIRSRITVQQYHLMSSVHEHTSKITSKITFYWHASKNDIRRSDSIKVIHGGQWKFSVDVKNNNEKHIYFLSSTDIQQNTINGFIFDCIVWCCSFTDAIFTNNCSTTIHSTTIHSCILSHDISSTIHVHAFYLMTSIHEWIIYDNPLSYITFVHSPSAHSLRLDVASKFNGIFRRYFRSTMNIQW